MRANLLKKTELRIDNIYLSDANLTDIASAAGCVLGLPPEEILVVDYQHGRLVLDILNRSVDACNIVGKHEALIKKLGSLAGVFVSEKTAVYSNGMLGWIALDEGSAVEALIESHKKVGEIRRAIARRVAVFSSGEEVAKKEIADTNTPAIKNRFEAEGYVVIKRETLSDDKALMSAKLRDAAELGGYGIIVITGGVGAERKDQTVEAIQTVDPGAATPYVCRFEKGTGRHFKDGVKIAVGRYNDTVIIALPGPNDEVTASLDPLIEGLRENATSQALAERIAANLRQILRRKMKGRKGNNCHEGCQLHLPD